MFRLACQCFLKDLGGDLHGADLAAGGAGTLGQTQEPPPGALAHGNLRVAYPVRIARAARPFSLPRHEPALEALDALGQPCGAERAAAGFGNLADDLGTEACGNGFDGS